ncbi:unnamed protein product, partial [Symbiodinium sp. CCMP2456]
ELSKSESSVRAPRDCPYEALGIERNATEAEIKQAYRRLALQRHPDKLPVQLGRQPDASELHAATEASWRITQAFEILSDPDRRQKYDEAVGLSSSGRFQEDAPMPCQPRGEARALLHGMQVNGDRVCASELSTAVLIELRAQLRAEQRVVSSSEADVVKRSVDRCISVSHGCCVVKVTWSSLDVITSSTKSLDQALRWRAALTVLRNRAKARMSLGGCSHTLIEEEVLDMLRADPDLNVGFSGAVYGTSKRTPKTPNWQLALTLQEQLLQVVKGRGHTESKVDKFIEKAKKTVEADKKKYKTLAAQQIREIDEELMRRQEQMLPHQSLAEALSLTDERELEEALRRLQELAPAELRRRRTILFSPANSLDGWEPRRLITGARAAGDEEEDEFFETPDEKRVRLAKEYLKTIGEGKTREQIQEELAKDTSRRQVSDLALGEPRFLRGHKMAVTSVCLTADEGTMYTGGKDCAVLRWDVETGKKDVFPGGRNKFDCGGHFEKVLSVALLEEKGLLVSVGVDRLVRLWDPRAAATDTVLLIFLLVKLLSLLKPSAPMHGAARHAHMVRAAAREAAAEMQKDGISNGFEFKSWEYENMINPEP